MKKCFLIFVIVIYFASSLVQSFAQTGGKSSFKVRQETFEMVWQTVNQTYFDPNFGGLDWKKIREIYAPLADQAKTDTELYRLLDEMLGKFKISHMKILTPEMAAKLKNPTVSTGIILREIDSQVVITRVIENSSAAKMKLRPGYTVVKINGKTIKNLADAKRELAGAPQSMVRLSFLNEKNETREIFLQRLAIGKPVNSKLAGFSLYATFESKILPDNIGYLRFSNFAGFLEPKIKEAIELMKDTRGMIIDLRGNSGGEDEVAINLAGMLFDKETQLMITRTREGDDLYYKAKPKKNPFLHPVVILVDEQSGSASEQFAAGLQEAERAFVIGKTTEGEDLDADLKELPTGAYLLYAYGEPRTPNGIIIEGRGVIPNLEVTLTRESLLAGKDLQVEAAINHIKASQHP